MKTYQTITTKEQRLESITCDLCGVIAPGGDWDIYEWDHDIYNDVSPVVRMAMGNSYPGDRWGTDYSVDICPTCFMEKLIPWLKSQGATVQKKEW